MGGFGGPAEGRDLSHCFLSGSSDLVQIRELSQVSMCIKEQETRGKVSRTLTLRSAPVLEVWLPEPTQPTYSTPNCSFLQIDTGQASGRGEAISLKAGAREVGTAR